ncbi:MAG: hypothetical protein P4L98_07315 [Ancalomicrobiaceae bacterium]|nr:hypothetical protein [Ancalomicrobiaceae bacterium]
MLVQIALIAYAVAAGFVSAGFIGSLYQLLTDSPPKFTLAADTLITGVSSAFVCIFAGPFIIMRQAIRGRLIERRPLGWLAASTAIASGWSLCLGILVIDFALAVNGAIA